MTRAALVLAALAVTAGAARALSHWWAEVLAADDGELQ